MPRFCFQWSLTGSTMIEAESLAAARAQWDKIEANSDILASADQVDFNEDQVLIEGAPGIFDEEPEPDPGSNDANCVHEWAYTGTAYGGDDESYMGEGRCYCVHCDADGDA